MLESCKTTQTPILVCPFILTMPRAMKAARPKKAMTKAQAKKAPQELVDVFDAWVRQVIRLFTQGRMVSKMKKAKAKLAAPAKKAKAMKAK